MYTPVVPQGARVCIWKVGALQYPSVLGCSKGRSPRATEVNRVFLASFSRSTLRYPNNLRSSTLGYLFFLQIGTLRITGGTRVFSGCNTLTDSVPLRTR